MILNSPYISGSLTVTGNTVLSGSVTLASGTSLSGTASLATSASFAVQAQTASYVVLAQSSSYAVVATTASYADALTVAGTLTAQTLVVQTITSSVDYVTGSTRFGSLLANTHVFTGSISITGSQTITGNNTTTGVSYIGNSAANSYLQFQTGGSTNYQGIITTNSNTDLLQINGGAGAHYDSGSGIGFMGADRYGSKTAGTVTIYAGNAVNNTAFGYISMYTGNTERIKINYSGNTTMNYTGSLTPLNNPTLIVGSLSGVTIPFHVVADSAGRLIRLMNSDFNNSNTGTDFRMGFAAGSGNTNLHMQVYNSGESTFGNMMLQPSYGYVGIGTTNTYNHKLWVQGNIRSGGSGLARTYFATISGTGGTFDIFRFLDDAGNVIASGGISGILFINAQDTATGGNQISYTFHLQTNGNGTAQANITQMSYQLRGNQPLQSVSLVNDGVNGAVKVQGNVPGGVSGCSVWSYFVGVAI